MTPGEVSSDPDDFGRDDAEIPEDSEVPVPVEPGAIARAVESGDKRAVLVALAESLAMRIDDPATPARDSRQMVGTLLDIMDEIAKIDAASGGDLIGRAAATADESLDTAGS